MNPHVGVQQLQDPVDVAAIPGVKAPAQHRDGLVGHFPSRLSGWSDRDASDLQGLFPGLALPQRDQAAVAKFVDLCAVALDLDAAALAATSEAADPDDGVAVLDVLVGVQLELVPRLEQP